MPKKLTEEEKQQRLELKKQKKLEIEQKRKQKAEDKKKNSSQSGLIKSFIKNSIFTNINWPREMKLCKKLLEEHSLKFLLTLDKNVPSLAWYYTDEGKDYLRLEKLKWDYVPKEYDTDYQETEKLEFQPIKKSKTLRDFIYGKT